MKIELHKKEGEHFTLSECIMIILLTLSTYVFIGYIFYILFIGIWR